MISYNLFFKHPISSILQLILVGDVLHLLFNNIKEMISPEISAIPTDGLPVSPEFAFGWIQVAIHFSMILVLIWCMAMIWKMRSDLDRNERFGWTWGKIVSLLMAIAFSVPALVLWIGNLSKTFIQGNQTIDWSEWLVLVSSLGQISLLILVAQIIWKRVWGFQNPTNYPT